jgi:hypothetical protein
LIALTVQCGNSDHPSSGQKEAPHHQGSRDDLTARRVKAPPQALTDALLRLPRTEQFEKL